MQSNQIDQIDFWEMKIEMMNEEIEGVDYEMMNEEILGVDYEMIVGIDYEMVQV